MAVTVETLEKLERRITLTLPAATINGEVENRLKKLSRTVKADGFRPGKVPMSVVAQRYGYSVQYEVVNDRVGTAFNEATNEAKLRVAGAPRITQKDESPEGSLAFDATFEVYPKFCASSAAPSVCAPKTKALSKPTASPSTSKARSTANPLPVARPKPSSSSSAKARCSSNSTRPCAA